MTGIGHRESARTSDASPIIVGGFFRSGTSLFRRLLDAHSRIHCPPEVKFFRDFYDDYLQAPDRHARFFATVKAIGLDEDELLSIFGGAYVRSRELAAHKLGKPRWADKNPENVLYLEQWSRILDGRFCFIDVVRHPLDVLASVVEARFDNTLPADLPGKIEVYARYTTAGLDFASRHPGRALVVKYESLVERPQQTMTDVMAFLGESFEPGMIEGAFAGARQRGLEDPKVERTTAIHAQSLGRWKRDLAAADARLARDRLATIIDALGYDA